MDILYEVRCGESTLKLMVPGKVNQNRYCFVIVPHERKLQTPMFCKAIEKLTLTLN